MSALKRTMGLKPISALILLFICLVFIGNAVSEEEISNDSFDLKSDNILSRMKRAGVSEIKHLWDESKIVPHSEQEKEDILKKHNEYRGGVSSPSASNIEYMVSPIFLSTTFLCVLKLIINLN